VRSLGFLISRRWALFAVIVVLSAWGAWLLGQWQFHRLADRKAQNAVIERNEHAPVAPVDDVLSTRPVDESQEYRRVRATGTYDVADTVVVRYRTRDGASGVDVVVPLRTPSGLNLLVDRGWLATGNRGADSTEAPAPPAGTVTVVGRVRVDATGGSTTVTDHSTRAVNSQAIGRAIDAPVYGGFVDLVSEDPAPATKLEPAELPELNNGPHFFYGLQWWFFGLLAIGGFIYLATDEWRMSTGRKARPDAGRGPVRAQSARSPLAPDHRARSRIAPGQRARSIPPSTGSITPEMNEAAGESKKAAARPNSSGSP
jgi:cytochrome oxidase assembly protein ShyY1